MLTLEPPVQTEPAAGIGAALSEAAIELVEHIKPSIVQVRRDEHGGAAGFIWRSDGAILTNHHVVAGDRGKISVLLTDGREFEARIVNQNAGLDLALLQIDAEDLPAAPVADSSQLRIGELVFAVGHPWGHPYVVTAGIVSALGTISPPGSRRTAQYIRSDVRLAPGNSGGPMLDAHGAVVGINAMIFGGDLAVAIPSHVATTWVAGQPSNPVRLGVQIVPVELAAAMQHGPLAGREAALLIGSVDPDGAAGRASVLPGDLLLSVDGQAVADTDTLLDTLAASAARGTIRLEVLRGGALVGLDVPLAAGTQSA
jgi:serine protease Do